MEIRIGEIKERGKVFITLNIAASPQGLLLRFVLNRSLKLHI